MPRVVGRVELTALGGTSALHADYARSISKGLPPFLNGVSGGRSFWESLRTDSDSDDSWLAVCDEILALSRRLGTEASVLSKLERARTRAAHFVVTGQQPGALGGPLHTAYKIATAIALAERIEATLGEACLALYWCGSDDSDFAEIRDVHLLTERLAPIAATIPQGAHDAGVPVGDIALDALRGVWSSVASFVGPLAGAEFTVRTVESAFERARDHGELSAAICTALFGGRLAVVDGRSSAVRRHSRELILRYLQAEDELKAAIAEQGDRLELAGYHSQLAVGADSGVFLMEDGRRKAVSAARREVLLAAAAEDSARCSPGVALRNLVQDYTFRPLAVVLGPSEIAYRAQIAPLYDTLNVYRPAAVPRASGTFVPSELAEMMTTDEAVTLVRDPALFARTLHRKCVPTALSAGRDSLQKSLTEAIDRFARVVDNAPVGKSQSRLKSKLQEFRKRLAQIEDAVEEVGKAEALSRWPMIRELTAAVRPSGQLQERTFSALVPFSFGGSGMCEDLTALAALHLDELLDGRSTHIVYSSQT